MLLRGDGKAGELCSRCWKRWQRRNPCSPKHIPWRRVTPACSGATWSPQNPPQPLPQPAQDLLCAGNRHVPITHEVGIPPHASHRGSRGREGCGWLPGHVRKTQEDTEGMSTAQPQSSGPLPQPQQTNLQSFWSPRSTPTSSSCPSPAAGRAAATRKQQREERGCATPFVPRGKNPSPGRGRARAGSTAPSAALHRAQRLQNRSLGHRGSGTLLLGENKLQRAEGGYSPSRGVGGVWVK